MLVRVEIHREAKLAFGHGTVFIIGAGASCEFNLPSGAELVERIARGANVSFGHFDDAPTGDQDLRQALQRTFKASEINERLSALRQIAAGVYMAESIDAYIDRHRSTPFVEEMGKFLIAYFLLKAEASSRLKVKAPYDEPLRLPTLSDTWLDTFARVLCSGIPSGREDEIGKGVTLISFNYDRCIERYLQQAFAQAFHVGPEKANTMVQQIRILRPYGSLGDLPPEPQGTGGAFLPYGANLERVHLPTVAARLRTFTERVEEPKLIEDIRNAVRQAQSLVFLGFGYHRQNLELLTVPADHSNAKHLFYSGKGVPEQAIPTILKRTVQAAGVGSMLHARGRTHFERDATASEVMRVHRMTLSA